MTEEDVAELLNMARLIARQASKKKRTRASATQRGAVLARSGGVCSGCGSGRGVRVHHRTPASKGGTNAPRNLVAYCEFCERADHARFRVK